MSGTGTIVTDRDVHWIVKVLQENPELIRKVERFCDCLEINRSDLELFRRSMCGPHELLPWALRIWMLNAGDNATLENLIDILKGENFNRTAQRLIEESARSHNMQILQTGNSLETADVWFEVPGPFPDFAGRVNDLEKLHKSITTQTKDNITMITAKTTTLVSGLGGIGKTTLAMHYAWKYQRSGFYSNVIWINSETFDTRKESLTRLVVHLKLNTIRKNPLEIETYKHMELIYERFNGQQNTLFIFDNVEDYESIKAYLPVIKPNVRNPFILLTSRTRILNDKVDRIELDVFEEDESVEFFTTYLTLTSDTEKNYAKKISTMLHYLPLAIRQAGAYIRTQKENLKTSNENEMRKYISRFVENSQKLLGYEYQNRTNDIYEQTTLTTWNVTMDKIKDLNPMSVDLMNLMSYLMPDNIPVSYLVYIGDEYFQNCLRHPDFPDITSHNALEENKSKLRLERIEEAISLLSDYSMIARQETNISVHRLVQHVIREQLVEESMYVDGCVQLVQAHLAANHDYDLCVLQGGYVVGNIEKAGSQEKYKDFIQLIEDKRNSAMNKQIQRIRELFRSGSFDEASLFVQECRQTWSKSKSNSKLYMKMSIKLFCELSRSTLIKEYRGALKTIADEIITTLTITSDLVVEFFVPGPSFKLFKYIYDNYKSEFEQMMQNAHTELKSISKEGSLWDNVHNTHCMVHYLYHGFVLLSKADECAHVIHIFNSYFDYASLSTRSNKPRYHHYVHFADSIRRTIFTTVQRPNQNMDLKSKLTAELLYLSVAMHDRFVAESFDEQFMSDVASTVVYCFIHLNKESRIINFVQAHLTCMEGVSKTYGNREAILSSLLEFSEMMLTHGRDGQNIKYSSLVEGSKLAAETYFKISRTHTQNTQTTTYRYANDDCSDTLRALRVVTNARLLLKLGVESNSFREASLIMSNASCDKEGETLGIDTKSVLKKAQRIFFDIANDLSEFGFNNEALANLKLLEECIMNSIDLEDMETLIDTKSLISKINVERERFEIALAKLREASGILIENSSYGQQSELNQIIEYKIQEIELMIKTFSRNENNNVTKCITLNENEIVIFSKITKHSTHSHRTTELASNSEIHKTTATSNSPSKLSCCRLL